MRSSIQLLASTFSVSVVLVFSSAGQALEATTTTALSLREGPGTNYARLATMPAGALVDLKDCRDNWCAVSWKGYAGYASQSWLLLGDATAHMLEPEVWPIFPPYPYRAGHYPKADWYYKMPPYTAISPSFYRKRFFMIGQERNRYRYMPKVFRDSGEFGSGGIEEIDLQSYGEALRSGVDGRIAEANQPDPNRKTSQIAALPANPKTKQMESGRQEAAVERGRSIAQSVCTVCHTLNKGGGTLHGPNLFGVVGRPVASVPDYPYSASLKGREGVWDPTSLDKLLEDPNSFSPGTSMIFSGLTSENDRRAVIEYLGSLKTQSASR